MVLESFEALSSEFIRCAEPRYKGVFPPEDSAIQVVGYLWARTITCPYCDGLVPLSPNWRLAPGGIGVRVNANLASGPGATDRICSFEVVYSPTDQSPGTVRLGTGTCPYPDCQRVIDGAEIKQQAQAGEMGEQLYAVAFKQRVRYRTKTGRIREKWVRRYRAPRPEDDNSAEIQVHLDEKLPEWEAFDIVPSERIPRRANEDLRATSQYGMRLWRDLFSAAPAAVPRHGRRSLPRNAGRRPGGKAS